MLNTRVKHRIFLILALMLATYFASFYQPHITPENDVDDSTLIQQLFEQKQSDVQIEISATVVRLLEDDLRGSRHQRFIVEVGSKQTLLVAHNIDLAPKIDSLAVGDEVTLFGEYEWSAKGGVIHWTHHDPKNKHPHGWIKHQGKLYQ